MRILILPPLAGLCAGLCAALAACTPTAADTARANDRAAVEQQKLATALAGLTPGKPVSCISQYQSQQVKGYGSTILYKVSNGLIYRSETGGGCQRVGNGDILITRSFSGQLCQGDIARTVDSTSRTMTGSCSFGEFTPYRKAGR